MFRLAYPTYTPGFTPLKSLFVLLLSFCASIVFAGSQHAQAPVTHGVAIGDVTATSAVIWSRTDRETTMHVRLRGSIGRPQRSSTRVFAADDYTGKLIFDDLKPNTQYSYKLWFSQRAIRGNNPASGTFKTAPASDDTGPITFSWGGDVAGQNVCRDAQLGFPVFDTIKAMKPDFFIGLGDMIYADGICNETGRYGNPQVKGDFIQSATMKDYWAHWKYNREDRAYRELLSSTPYFPIWDDHEVINDFGPLSDTRSAAPYAAGEHLLPKGLKAFLNYNPVEENQLTPSRLYRNIRWGQHLEMIVLDNRQYRDANISEDKEGEGKTMLGREQLHWLKERLKETDATWKVIVTTVPLSIPTGFPADKGRDGWANFEQNTGFEQELVELMRYLRDEHIQNTVFITTDVHFAEVFRYTPFSESPDFQVHEYVTGPLNAGLFPNRNFDESLGTESLFFFGPDSSAVTTYEDAMKWMNFGAAKIDASGNLTLSVRDVNGEVLYQATHQPQ